MPLVFFRHFIEHDLVNYAKENPEIVVYVKPRRHRHPVIVAEYRTYATMYIRVTRKKSIYVHIVIVSFPVGTMLIYRADYSVQWVTLDNGSMSPITIVMILSNGWNCYVRRFTIALRWDWGNCGTRNSHRSKDHGHLSYLKIRWETWHSFQT